MDDAIVALGNAVGAGNITPDIDNGTVSYERRAKDFTKIQELYKNKHAKPMIDQFCEMGKIDKSMFGINT